MCFCDPGRVFSIDGSMARVATNDGLCDVSLRLIEAAGDRVQIGDWVMLSLGLVVSVVDEADGQAAFDEIAALRRGGAA